ncbi:hypothetical protein [Planktothricoides sp. SR001]|nr:hypothetical protein [Planktothricoides sp. SR001]
MAAKKEARFLSPRRQTTAQKPGFCCGYQGYLWQPKKKPGF